MPLALEFFFFTSLPSRLAAHRTLAVLIHAAPIIALLPCFCSTKSSLVDLDCLFLQHRVTPSNPTAKLTSQPTRLPQWCQRPRCAQAAFRLLQDLGEVGQATMLCEVYTRSLCCFQQRQKGRTYYGCRVVVEYSTDILAYHKDNVGGCGRGWSTWSTCPLHEQPASPPGCGTGNTTLIS